MLHVDADVLDDLDRLLLHPIEAWRRWQADDLKLGYPTAAAGVRWRPSSDFDSMADSADRSLAEIVDVVIDDLPVPLRRALHARFLGCRWPFDPAALLAAKQQLAAALHRKGVL